MREIKFRAWDIKNKKMVWPLRLFGHKAGLPCRLYTTEVKDKEGNVYTVKSQIILLQYTGLKDKNGKEIYEGDIVKIKKNKYEVGYWKGCFMFVLRGNNGNIQDAKNVNESIFLDCESNFIGEVIGNIYENPELININEQR